VPYKIDNIVHSNEDGKIHNIIVGCFVAVPICEFHTLGGKFEFSKI